MRSCWKFEPIERPDFGELVKKIDNLKDELQKNTPLSGSKLQHTSQ